jgi:hypothetical protein
MDSRSTVYIETGFPDRKIHPNGGKNWKWQAVARLTQEARLEGKISAMDELRNRQLGMPWRRAKVTHVFHFANSKSAKLSDGDNLNAWLKATRDGFADAGIVENDRDFTVNAPLIRMSNDGRDYVTTMISEDTQCNS